MALKGQISLSLLSVSILALELSLWLPQSISSPGAVGHIGARSAPFREVSQPVVTSQPDPVLLDVSVHEAGDFPVVQQPAGDTNFVSKNDGEVTQFASASRYGNIGLLAHNYLSGKSFSNIRIGQKIHLLYSDGRTENFIVTEILRYKALDPKSPYSSFQNLDDKNEILTVSQMFDRAYQGGHHVTFQTCIAAQGDSSWGRLFIIASPDPSSLGYEPGSLAKLP
ncbi:MAG: hypothetical protein ACM3PS_09435 [Syntrophothermus sp.]